MKVTGKRIKIHRWIQGGSCAVRVEVEAVIPDGDESEPCLEPQTLRWLEEVRQMAVDGRFNDLAKVGEVYVRRSA